MPTERGMGASGGRSHIRGLDGIRAVAFLLVLGGHSGFSWIPNGFGVTVFFFLSGYLITTLLRLEWIQSGSISVSRFYVRRAFRILPPLYVAVIFAVIVATAGLTNSGVHWKAMLVVQLFLTNYSDYLVGHTMTVGLSVLWSLAVEEHFYLVFPFLYRALQKSGVPRLRQVILFGCVCLLALAWRATLIGVFHADWDRVYTGTDTRIDSILYGSIMAIALNPVIDNLSGLSRRLCATAAIVSVVVLFVSIAVRGEVFRQTLRYTIQGLALLPIFLYVTRYADSALTRFLELRFFTHIGELSYSLYVVHFTILAVVGIWVKSGPFVTLILTSAFSYVFALAIHRYVELPSHRMRNRVLRRLEEKRLGAAVLSSS